MTLYSFCNGNLLSADKCSNERSLADTFKDACSFYTGKTPSDGEIAKFMKDKEMTIEDNFLTYDFSY